MKQHQFFNVDLAYQLDSIIQDIGEWNGIQFMLQSKYVMGIAQKWPLPIRVVSCHASKLKEMESNDRYPFFSQNCHFEAEKIDLETISQSDYRACRRYKKDGFPL